jgi:hypothetical protein
MNLVERLRYESPGPNHIATEAADEIERLQKIEAAAKNLLAQRWEHFTVQKEAQTRLEEVLK